MGMHVHCDGEGCTVSAPVEAESRLMGPLMPSLNLPAGWRALSWQEAQSPEESELESRRAVQIRQRLTPGEMVTQVPHINIRRSLLCPTCGAKVSAKSEIVGQIPQLPPGVADPFGSLVS